MKASTVLCCSLLAFVAVSQVAGYDARVSAATERLQKQVDRMVDGIAKRLSDRVQAPFVRDSIKLISARESQDAVTTRLVTRIQAKSVKHADCGKTEDAARKVALTAARTAADKCETDAKTTTDELSAIATKGAADLMAKSKLEFAQCAATGDRSREKSESVRCVTRRASEWTRLLREVERSLTRIVANRVPVLVQRNQRCFLASGKDLVEAVKTLTAELIKCDIEASKPTTGTGPAK